MDGPSFAKAMADAMFWCVFLAFAAGGAIVGLAWFLYWLFW